MAKTLPYFKWFAADAETDDFYAGLTNEELGFYHRCLNRAWLNAGIPKDLDALAAVLRMPRKQVDRVWAKVGLRWVQSQTDSGKLVNPRQEEERSLAAQKSDNNKRVGNANASRTRTKREAIVPQRAYESVSVSDSTVRKEVISLPNNFGTRFSEWWTLWSSIKGTNHMLTAEGVFAREVPADRQADCMACTASYLQSLENPAKGYNPENFLVDQGQDKFTARWPIRAPPKPTQQTSLVDRTMALMAKRIEKGDRPF